MARAKDTVVVGWVHPLDVGAGFCDSMLALHVHDLLGPGRLAGRIGRYSSANISNARNGVVRQFLEKSTADWLLMIDTDMSFPPDAVDRLLVNASRSRAPIVGGLCFGVEDGELFPTLYDVREDADGVHMVRYHEYPADSMFQVAATGAAFLLMHRDALQRIGQAQADAGNTAYPWFQETALNGAPMGEDVTFCLRAGMLGIPVWVDTGLPIGHMKSYELTEAKYLAQRRAAQTPPAADPSQSAAGGTS